MLLLNDAVDEHTAGAEWFHFDVAGGSPQGHAQEQQLQKQRGTSSFDTREEEIKYQIAMRMDNAGEGKSGTSGELAIDSDTLLAKDEADKEFINGTKPTSETAVELANDESNTLRNRLLLERAQVEKAMEEINRDWREKMDEKRRAKMEKHRQWGREKQLHQMDNKVQPNQQQQLSIGEVRKEYGAQFNSAKFRADVDNDKLCNGEPLKVAEHYLFRYSNKMGIYHPGMLVCGIEIHFHRPGIEFWKPTEYSTRFVGAMHRDYRTIHYNGHGLTTHKSFRQIVTIVKQMEAFFNPNTYNILTRNCLLFIRTFVRQITGLTNGEHIDWPWCAIHPLKKVSFAAKKLKRLLKEGIMGSDGGKSV